MHEFKVQNLIWNYNFDTMHATENNRPWLEGLKRLPKRSESCSTLVKVFKQQNEA